MDKFLPILNQTRLGQGCGTSDKTLVQWFPNFFGSRTTWKNLVVREGQNVELYRDSRTTSANLADHLWSAEQTLGITALVYHVSNLTVY